jgi:hypothetical protein
MLIQSGGSKPFVVPLMEILADEFPYIIFKMGGFVIETSAASRA